MWVIRYTGTDSRFKELIDQVNKRIRQEYNIDVTLIEVNQHSANRKFSSTKSFWETLAPASDEERGVPDILVAWNEGWVPKQSIMPQTCRIANISNWHANSAQVDGIISRSSHFRHDYMYKFANCAFDPQRYASPIKRFGSGGERNTVAVLIGKLNAGTDQKKCLLHLSRWAQKHHIHLLVSTSRRTDNQDIRDIQQILNKNSGELFQFNIKNTENPYYDYLARAERMVAIDSGSMAAEAAHTGKPVHADDMTLNLYPALKEHVHAIKADAAFNEPALPKLDIAGDMAKAIMRIYERFLAKQSEQDSWVQREASRAESGGELKR